MTPDVAAASPAAPLFRYRPVGLLSLAFALILALLVVAPMIAMALQAFGGSDTGLARFLAPFVYPNIREAFVNTIVICGGTALLATVSGTILAWIMVRTDTPFGPFLEKVCQIPIFIPPFVGAIAWTLLAAPRMGLLNTWLKGAGVAWQLDVYTYTGMIWVLGIYLAPYVMLVVSAAMRGMDPTLEEAAQISGLTKLQTALKVTVPLLAPSIAAGASISFALALGLFGTPMVLGWARQILVLTGQIMLASQTIPPSYDLMAILSIYLMLISTATVYIQKRLLGDRHYYTVTGKGFRPRLLELGAVRWLALALIAVYVILTIAAPVYVLILASMSSYTWSGLVDPGLLAERILDRDVIEATSNSVILALYTATIAVALAAALSWLFVRTNATGKGVLEYIVLMPIAIPGITFGVGVFLLWIYIPLPVYGTDLIIVFAFLGSFMAFAVRSITASLGQVHPELEESARICGYGPLRTFCTITAPLIFPAMLGSWLLIFSFCMTELSMVLLLYTSENKTLSVLVFERWEMGDFSNLAAMALLQVFIGMTFVALSRLVVRRREA